MSNKATRSNGTLAALLNDPRAASRDLPNAPRSAAWIQLEGVSQRDVQAGVQR